VQGLLQQETIMASGRKPTYWEKLQDPRWQKKRLEVLQREDFTCEWCQSRQKTLHVHHGYYERGLDPWEYADDTLHCLCEDCHETAGGLLKEAHETIAKIRDLEVLAAIPNIVELQRVVWPWGVVPDPRWSKENRKKLGLKDES
jgi:hypothetical protein